MRKELVNQQIKLYTDVDLNVQVVQMNPLAVYNAMYYDSRTNGTTMIVDLGAENTDLIICDNESVWMRSIPIGGNNFTEALVKAFKLPFPKAEDLKRNAATSKYARQIFQAMRPIFADLVAEIQRSVGFYASVHRDSRIKKVLALGGTFKLPGLQKYLQQNLQLDVERLDTLSAAPSSDSKLAPNFNENILSIVSAYGLAIQAMGQAKITSSLLPAAIRREKLWRQKIPLFGAAAALFVAGLGVSVASWWINDLSLKGAASDQAQIEQISQDATKLDNDWAGVESAGAQDRLTINNVRSLLQYRSLWPQILNDFYSAMPQANPDVIKAQPQLASNDPAEIKQIPRNQRQLVMIDSIVTDYYPDITSLLSSQDIRSYADYSGAGPQPGMMQPGAGPAGVDAATGEGNLQPSPQPGGTAPPAAAPGAAGAPRGFVMTVHCVTPFATGDQLVQNKVLPALMAMKSMDKDRSYAIVKAQLVSPIKVNEDVAKRSKMVADYQAALTAANALISNNNPGGAPGGDAAAGGGALQPPGGGNPAAPGGPNDQNAC
jgi:type IV pilus assembly protein PilM